MRGSAAAVAAPGRGDDVARPGVAAAATAAAEVGSRSAGRPGGPEHRLLPEQLARARPAGPRRPEGRLPGRVRPRVQGQILHVSRLSLLLHRLQVARVWSCRVDVGQVEEGSYGLLQEVMITSAVIHSGGAAAQL